jgi:hypothetical protein
MIYEYNNKNARCPLLKAHLHLQEAGQEEEKEEGREGQG